MGRVTHPDSIIAEAVDLIGGNPSEATTKALELAMPIIRALLSLKRERQSPEAKAFTPIRKPGGVGASGAKELRDKYAKLGLAPALIEARNKRDSWVISYGEEAADFEYKRMVEILTDWFGKNLRKVGE
jgi:hypothetical protein